MNANATCAQAKCRQGRDILLFKHAEGFPRIAISPLDSRVLYCITPISILYYFDLASVSTFIFVKLLHDSI